MKKYKEPYETPIPGRTGKWIQTMMGKRFFHQDPRPDDFLGRSNEIAEVLAKIPRFGGHTPGVQYSVAEHCYLVSVWAWRIAPRALQTFAAQVALLHDAAEAYIGDMVKPQKDDCSAFRQWESAVEPAIFAAFGIAEVASVPEIRGIVKRADLEVLGAESRAFMPNPEWSVIAGYPPAPVEPEGLPWKTAKQLWLSRFKELF
jgi:hypothetical protein